MCAFIEEADIRYQRLADNRGETTDEDRHPHLRRRLGSIDFGARGRCSLLPERREQAAMMPALSATKALGLIAIFAIFAIAVSAGCSSPSPQSSPTTGKHLKGSMDEWVNAVCTKRGPLPMKRGRMLGNSTTNPTVCLVLPDGDVTAPS